MAERPSQGLFWVITALLALVVAVFGYGVIRERRAVESADDREVPRVLPADPVRGQPGAPLTIIEYGDFFCPLCRSEQPALKTFLVRYDARVRLVWKDFPITEQHPLDAAEAARCAQEQGAFWQMHDALFAHQETLGDAVYTSLAQNLGLDPQAFDECRASDRTLALINESIEGGRRAGVDGTPLYFFGTTPVTQLPSPEALDQFMQQ
ncbi:MAG: DsbA family protein [Candidatus Kerfeldbacteria bacterium]|nr:DsbA family protein [Candidatus Kerfeldbacteria bacterium]